MTTSTEKVAPEEDAPTQPEVDAGQTTPSGADMLLAADPPPRSRSPRRSLKRTDPSRRLHPSRPPRCPNCEEEAPGAFCAACGQQQGELRVSTGAMLRNFAESLIRVDGKLLRTLRLLILHPGELTLEHHRGRRVRYEKPFRIFVVCSLLYFLVLGLGGSGFRVHQDGGSDVRVQLGWGEVAAELAPSAPGLAEEQSGEGEGTVQRRLRTFLERGNDAVSARTTQALRRVGPKLSFILMPVMALALMLLYRRRGWLFSEHFVFALHLSAFTSLTGAAAGLTGSGALEVGAHLVDVAYLFMASRKAYGLGRWGTLLRSGAFLLVQAFLQGVVTLVVLGVAVLSG